MKFPSYKPEENVIKTIWLKEGQEYVGVFRGDIHEYQIHWSNKKKYVCVGVDKGCIFCANLDKPKFHFRVNFVHKNSEGNFECSLYEQDWFTYGRMCKLNEKHPLETSVVKVYKGLDNGFKVDLFAHLKTLEGAALDAIAQVPLLPVIDQTPNYATSEDFDPSQDIPF